MYRKILAMLLAALLLAPSMTACGGGEGTETTPAETTPAETVPEETEIRDDLPEGLKFTGETFTILNREDLQWENEMVTPELSGDIVNDAIYNREITVEERLDVKIDAFKTPGIWGNENAFNDKIRTAVQAGDASYQLVAGYAYFITALATEGLFTNLLTVPYLDFDKPWWNSNLRDELTLYDQLYFAGGDLSYTMISSMFCTFLNKDMMEKHSVEDLYSVVNEGRWTYDYQYALAETISVDVDGNGTMDQNDEYGLVIPIGNASDCFFAAYDQPLTAKDGDGNVVLRMGDAKAVEIAERMMSFYDKTKTSAEIVLDFYRLIKETAGDMYIIGCNTFSHLIAGLAEMNRVGDDTSGHNWDRTRAYGVNSLAFRLPQHNAFYAIDADCVGFEKNIIDWKFNGQFADLLAKSGTPFFISSPNGILSDEEIKGMKAAFARFIEQKDTIEPLDWEYNDHPRIWKVNGEVEEYEWQKDSIPVFCYKRPWQLH